MPHQCVRCSKIHDDGSTEILNGCSCGGKLFFFIKKSRLEEAKKLTVNLSKKEKVQVEEDIKELVGVSKDDDTPVVLDFESIRVLKPGQYELDLVNLFKKEPLIFRLEEGKYMIDLPATFKEELDKEK